MKGKNFLDIFFYFDIWLIMKIDFCLKFSSIKKTY